jgi:hypothetical protein
MPGQAIQTNTPTSWFFNWVWFFSAESNQHSKPSSVPCYGVELCANVWDCEKDCQSMAVAGCNQNRFPQDGSRLEQLKARLGTVRQLWASVGQGTNRAHSPSQRCYHVDLMQPLVCKLALKIRVSAVRFCPRPPIPNTALPTRCGVFLFPPQTQCVWILGAV